MMNSIQPGLQITKSPMDVRRVLACICWGTLRPSNMLVLGKSLC